MRSRQQNLVLRCGLDDKTDGGTFRFLCGLSLAGDTTSSNYTSFTSEEAQERLYYLLRPLQPEADIAVISPEQHEDGSVTYHVTPKVTAEHAGAIVKVLLQPGEELSLDCLHGVIGNLRTEKWIP